MSVAVAIMAILGCFYDLEIAKAVYVGQSFKENPFGIIFALIGVIPTFVGWSFLGASILHLVNKNVEKGKKRNWLIALAVLLFVLSFFYFCNTLFLVNASAFSVHWAIAYPIGIVVIAIAAYAGYALSKSSDNPQLLKSVLFLTYVSLITMVIIMLTKEIASRPRYRFVLSTENEEFFRDWWQNGRAIKEELGSSAVKDEFASFPSGHSAYAMFAIFIFPLLAEYVTKLRKYKAVLFIAGIVWWGLTALSRMMVGAHYLTDVTIAGLVTIAVYALMRCFNSLQTKKNNLTRCNDE